MDFEEIKSRVRKIQKLYAESDKWLQSPDPGSRHCNGGLAGQTRSISLVLVVTVTSVFCQFVFDRR